ncbi:MAG: pinensin family lanthipeptide [Cyclobacteriaceae bacterium]
MKKNKIDLEQLSVKSFVTNITKSDNRTVKGGRLSFRVCYSDGCQYPTRPYEATCEGGATIQCPPEEVSFYC